jgi:hypothetical protein
MEKRKGDWFDKQMKWKAWRRKNHLIYRRSNKIIGPSAGRNLFSYCGSLPLQTAKHVSVIFRVLNNVGVN